MSIMSLNLAELLQQPEPCWYRDAACREHDDVNFFPQRGESSAPAMAVCFGCLVKVECLSFAMRHELQGVWGGTTAKERARRRRPSR